MKTELIENYFISNCENGYINVAKWVYNLSKININIQSEYVFVYARMVIANFKKKNLNIININNNQAFRYACENNEYAFICMQKRS